MMERKHYGDHSGQIDKTKFSVMLNQEDGQGEKRAEQNHNPHSQKIQRL